MGTMVFTGNRLVELRYLLPGRKRTEEYAINERLERINEACNQGVGYGVTKKMTIHMDNCPVHTAIETLQAIQTMKLQRLVNPYSPHLSPCHFGFFGWTKGAMQHRCFVDADQLLEAPTNRFDTVTFEEL
jgi:hypothetical protein